jgi:hypothetical protein
VTPVTFHYSRLLISRPNYSAPFRGVTLNVHRDGDPGRIRTGNLLLRREVIYPIELQSHIKFYGGTTGIRTRTEGVTNPNAVPTTPSPQVVRWGIKDTSSLQTPDIRLFYSIGIVSAGGGIRTPRLFRAGVLQTLERPLLNTGIYPLRRSRCLSGEVNPAVPTGVRAYKNYITPVLVLSSTSSIRSGVLL